MRNHRKKLLRIGVSSCLLGDKVRYDGGHKRDRFLAHNLGRYVEWVPVCPEVELGLGTPREPIQLIRIDGAVRLLQSKTGEDLTEDMLAVLLESFQRFIDSLLDVHPNARESTRTCQYVEIAQWLNQYSKRTDRVCISEIRAFGY